MIAKEDFYQILNQELSCTNLEVITQKIVNQEHFDPSLVKELEPKKKLIEEIIKYILLRDNIIHIDQVEEKDILNLQSRLREQLSSINFDIIEHERSQSNIFIERMVLISLLLPSITNKLNFNFLTKIQPKQLFIVLLFLASGKLVSIRTFDLAREKMRKRHIQRQKYSIYSTIQTTKSSKRQRKVQNSELVQFKEDLKRNLFIEKEIVSKENKSKYLLRRNAAHFRTKISSSQKYQIIEPWEGNTKKSLGKRPLVGKINSVSYNGRVSLDKNMIREHLRSVCCSPHKNTTYGFVFNKPSKNHLRPSGQSVKRALSVNLKP